MKASSVITIFAFCLSITGTTDPKGPATYTESVTTSPKGAGHYTESVTTSPKGAGNHTGSVATSPKGAGNHTGSGDTNTTSSIGTPKSTTAADTQKNGDADHAALLNSKDKNSLWALLLVIPGAAGIYYVGSKLCKSRSHPGDTTDNGMENASFQSRPESIKDGVMLLGVKTSGTDDGAAARS